MTSPMGNCPQCGTRILPGSLVCINCQTPLAQPAAPEQAPPPPYAPPPGQPYAPPPPYGPPPGQPYYPPGYGYGYGWGGPQTTTNGMAIASLVLAVVWVAGLGSILAVIFGHVARRQLKTRPEKGGGLALAGLIVGYLGIVLAVGAGIAVAVVFTNPGIRNSFVRNDLNNAAVAEQTYLVDHGSYTDDSAALRDDGFTFFPTDTVAVAYNGAVGYCIVGSRNGRNDWYLYDSKAFGLSMTLYPDAVDAEQACSVPDLSPFATIS